MDVSSKERGVYWAGLMRFSDCRDVPAVGMLRVWSANRVENFARIDAFSFLERWGRSLSENVYRGIDISHQCRRLRIRELDTFMFVGLEMIL